MVALTFGGGVLNPGRQLPDRLTARGQNLKTRNPMEGVLTGALPLGRLVVPF